MIFLKPVFDSDELLISEISALSNKIWNAYYPSIITQAQIDYMLQKYHAVDVLREQIKNGHQYFLIRNDEQTIGYCGVYIQHESLFLNKLYILNEIHGKGVGKQALSLLLEKFKVLKKCFLQVNRQNIQAINFYFKQGFKIARAENFDIGDGYWMEDFVMERTS